MKVKSVKLRRGGRPVPCVATSASQGYVKQMRGGLPDVDIDFEGYRRQEVKEYTERRYNINGRTRVFSAGTFTTMRPKQAIKDVARVMKIPVGTVNYITSMIPNEAVTYSDIFALAVKERKLAAFINEYPELFERIRPLMGQPRSSSVHASALIITPETLDGKEVDCWDYTPIKKVDGMLLSEFSGYDLDETGMLKNDCLGAIELSKLKKVFDIVEREYGEKVTLEEIATGDCDYAPAYRLLADGYTQNVFQCSSPGMTKFLKKLKPESIRDLVAANALYRPATLSNGAVDQYLAVKQGANAAVYMWGCYDILKETYAQVVYQEQMARIAREVGGFSLKDGVTLIKLISKKKVDKIKEKKAQFMTGALEKGCPEDQAAHIWETIESGGSYLFNKSHATAYGITAYAGAYLKARFPTAFYTVALEEADDKELPAIMSEMSACSVARVVPPDINASGLKFHTDYATDRIYWSLLKIKMVGEAAVEYIVAERDKNGPYLGIEDFISRVFWQRFLPKPSKKKSAEESPREEISKYPVTSRHVLNLILAGCFDAVEKIDGVCERYGIVMKAAVKLGFEMTPAEFPAESIDKHYFWSQKQIQISGLGTVDYKRMFDNSSIKPQLKGKPFVLLADALHDEKDGTLASICASVVEVEQKKYDDKKDKTMCRMTLQQNGETNELVIWSDQFEENRDYYLSAKGHVVAFGAKIKYSDFQGRNTLQFPKNAEPKFQIL